MLIKQEQINPCEVELEMQAEAAVVKKAIDDVYKEFSKYTTVPGFRKGKAPRHLLENIVDKGRVREFVVDRVLDELYDETVKESGLEPFAQGSVDIKEFELDDPDLKFVASAIVPLKPQVDLGEYKSLKVTKRIQKIDDEDVENEISMMLRAIIPSFEVEDGEVEDGDELRVRMLNLDELPEGSQDDSVQGTVHSLRVGNNLPDVDDALKGMKLDETKDIAVNYPEDFGNEELRGKTVNFRCTVTAINRQTLPELNDAWVDENAQKLFPNRNKDDDAENTVDALKQFVHEKLQESSESISEEKLVNNIIDTLLDNTQVHFPRVMLDSSINDHFSTLNERLESNKVTFAQYLQYANTTAEEYYEKQKTESERSLKVGLLLREIVDQENIEVNDEDVDKEIETMAEKRQVPVETMRAYVENKGGISTVKDAVLQRRLFDYLKNTLTVEIEEE